MELVVDTGGTFTDLVIRQDDGSVRLFKSPTTPDDPVRGLFAVIDVAAHGLGLSRTELLGRAERFIHATTRATNATLTNKVARTAFLTTKGHPDILLFREGGRTNIFDNTRPYPEPYVPRALTFEVPERITYDGNIRRPLDLDALAQIIDTLARERVEAVAVCLLWSIVNPVHEIAIGEQLEQRLPGVPHTLSHRLNPIIREYRRASSTAIDASLKPLMTHYLSTLSDRLRDAGFGGRVLAVTSAGAIRDLEDVAAAPIHSVGSGPAMAPVAGRHFATLERAGDNAIVADAGGTSYDVSLVRRGQIPWTREAWLGERWSGHITGFASVDVRSIGAGGGSVAWVDTGGLLHVGPESAGASPGPACYGRGGTRPTVTDAAVALGYIDADYFLGGAMRLDGAAAANAIAMHVADALGISVEEAAVAILRLTTEHMIRAIEEITLNQGIDPRSAALVAGGGAAGLNATAIARELGIPLVIIPEVAAALSASGGLLSELSADYSTTMFTTSDSFDFAAVNSVIADLQAKAEQFATTAGHGAVDHRMEFFAEVRYPQQAWELEVALRTTRIDGDADVEQLRQDFHAVHAEVFAIADDESPIEVVSWRVHVACRIRDNDDWTFVSDGDASVVGGRRRAYFAGVGAVETPVLSFGAMERGRVFQGPAIVESPVTTVVVDAGATVRRSATGSLVIHPRQALDAAAAGAMRSEAAGA